jgi:RimJ/RimL family protein N-acetyltransferase
MADPAAADDLLGTWAAHWQARGVGPWAIAAQDAPQQVIGFGGLSWRDFGGQQHPNLWYRLAPEAWGAGYATEFATVALHHAQTVGGVRVVHALVQPAHRASIRVLEKLGLRPIGTQSDVHGGPDSLHYCLELAP